MSGYLSSQRWLSDGQEAVFDDPAAETLYTSSRQRSSSRASTSKHRQHQNSAVATSSYAGSLPFGRVAMPTTADEAREEADGYLPPLLAPSNRRRERLNSIESWGSSVMPAALPFAQHRNRGGEKPPSASSLRQRDHSEDRRRASQQHRPQTEQGAGTSPVLGAGLEGWLQSQSHAVPPQTSHGHIEAKQQASRFPSFAPPGRVRRRVESETGSAGGEGSLGGWSNGVTSASGRRRTMGRGGGRDTTRMSRVGLPLWEGDAGLMEQEEPHTNGDGEDRGVADPLPRRTSVSSNLSSVLQWRDSSAIPSSLQRGSRSSKTGPGSVVGPYRESPSVTGSIFPRSASRQTLRPLDLGQYPLAEQTKKQPESTPLRTFVRGMMKEGLSVSAVILIGLGTLLVTKWAIAGGGWSSGVRPGWETTRHWLALTTNLPADEWYLFDVDHRLLDRPPLAGYLSWCFGRLAANFPTLSKDFVFPPPIGIHPSAHIYMVLSHLLSSHLLYNLPVLWYLNRRLADRGRRTIGIVSLTVLSQPALLLADYGLGGWHSICLGLLTLTFALLLTSLPNAEPPAGNDTSKNCVTSLSRQVSYRYIVAIIVFALAISFDQRALSFAPVVSAVVLGRWAALTSVGAFRGFIFCGGVVIASIFTFLLVFGPWLSLTTAEPLRQIHERLSGAHTLSPLLGKSNAWPQGDLYLVNLLYEHLPYDKSSVSLTITILATAFPLLVLLCAAWETVRIEMRIDEAVVALGPPSLTGRNGIDPSFSGSVRSRAHDSSSTVAKNMDPRRSDSGISHRYHKPSASLDTGSDLRSFAESIVRGDSSMTLSQRADREWRPPLSPPLGSDHGKHQVKVSASCPSPSAAVLPYAAASVSLATYLFYPSDGSYDASIVQVLYPLLPLTLLTVAKGDEWGGGAGKVDWEWIVLSNNVGTFSLWPLIRRDGLPIQYFCSVFLWNFLIGYRPFADLTGSRRTTVGIFGAVVHSMILIVHAVSLFSLLFDTPPILIPTLVNLVSTFSLFVVYLWSIKRVAEVALGNGLEIGLSWGRGKATRKQQLDDRKKG